MIQEGMPFDTKIDSYDNEYEYQRDAKGDISYFNDAPMHDFPAIEFRIVMQTKKERMVDGMFDIVTEMIGELKEGLVAVKEELVDVKEEQKKSKQPLTELYHAAFPPQARWIVRLGRSWKEFTSIVGMITLGILYQFFIEPNIGPYWKQIVITRLTDYLEHDADVYHLAAIGEYPTDFARVEDLARQIRDYLEKGSLQLIQPWVDEYFTIIGRSILTRRGSRISIHRDLDLGDSSAVVATYYIQLSEFLFSCERLLDDANRRKKSLEVNGPHDHYY